MSKKPAARYWDVDEIPPLPKSLYRSVFGEDYNENWVFIQKELSPSEKNTVTVAFAGRKFREVYRIPEVIYPEEISSPDLFIDGQLSEIKRVSSARSIEKQISKASKQAGKDGWIILDTSSSNLTTEEQVAEINRRMGQKGITEFSVINGKKRILDTKKDNSAIASYAANDSELSKVNISQKVPKNKHHAYWEERSIRRSLEAEHHSLSYLRQIYNVYSEASKEITKQVQDIYVRYYKDKGFDVEALRELVPQGDILRLKEQIRELGLNIDLPDNYSARINRLEFLNLQMQVEVNRASKKIDKLTGKSLADTYKNSYYRTAYDTSKGIGEMANFSKLNTKSVRKVLSEKNYGKNFSERIWGRSQKLGNELKEIVGKAIATGQSHTKTSRLIRERFNVSKSSADRLIRTETNYYENQAELDSYKEMGIEKYQFIATIDTRTSEICQHLDKKVFRVKDATPGVNMPPMHPNCRSTITAYIGEEYEADTRIARNRRTNISEYIENMSYKEWLKQFSDLDTDISEDWSE